MGVGCGERMRKLKRRKLKQWEKEQTVKKEVAEVGGVEECRFRQL